MAIQSSDEALRILQATRAHFIDEARSLAVEICQAEGVVHARRVYEAMADAIQAANCGSYWLGNVFHKSVFEWTGEWHQVDNYTGAANFHGPIGIRVWRLRDDWDGALPARKTPTRPSLTPRQAVLSF